jgi:hypothetical protein
MRTSHRTSLVVGLATVFVWPALSLADDPGLKDLERQFRELPMEARRLTGPLFWLHGDETRAQLELEVAKVAEGVTEPSRPSRVPTATGSAQTGIATSPFASRQPSGTI